MMNRKAMSRLLTYLMLPLVAASLSGCETEEEKRQRAEINEWIDSSPLRRDLLIGTWQSSADGKTNVITYHADGSFGSKWETGSWGILTPTAVRISGKWKLNHGDIQNFLGPSNMAGGTVKYTITQSSFDNEEWAGQIMTDTIMSMDDTTVVFSGDVAGGSTWIRQN